MKPTAAMGRVNAATLLLGLAWGAGACRQPVGPTAPATTLTSITGQVTDSTTTAPISGATVTLPADPVLSAITDSTGSYTLTLPPYPSVNYRGIGIFWASANNYERDYRFYGPAPQNFQLYPIIRIAAGNSVSVTIAPTDTMCLNNAQDTPPTGQVCRTVRVVPASGGILTLEALPAVGAVRPGLEVETAIGGNGATLANPAAIAVTAGTEVIANIEMPASSVTSQTFTLNTSIAGP